MSFSVVLSDTVAIFMLWMFLLAGFSKLNPANRNFYNDVIASYGIALPELAKVIVLILGSVELLAGLLVLFPASRFIGSMLCATLLTVYFFAMAMQIVRGKSDADCGCAGPGQTMKISPALLLRNLIYLGILSSLWFSPVSSFSLNFADLKLWLLPIVVAMAMVLISSSVENLLENTQKITRIKQRF